MKKILSYILVIAMLLTFVPTAFASTGYTFSFGSDTFTVETGASIEIPVYIKNNAGGDAVFEGFESYVNIPSDFTIESKIAGCIPESDMSLNGTVLGLYNDTSVVVTEASGYLAFKVKIKAPDTVGTYPLTFGETFLAITDANGYPQLVESYELKEATITVTEPAPTPAKLTLLNRKAYGINATTSQWAYSYYGDTTVLNDGLGGMVTGNYGRYSQLTTGQNNMIQITSNADYFANNYFLLSFNVYGNATVKFRFSSSTYDKDFDSTVLKANQWNNITMIYDVNKTSGKNGYFYVNGTDFGSYIGNGPDVSSGAQMRIYMQDTTATYYIDDLAIYSANELPTVTMPTVTAGSKYTVDANTITYTEAMTVADITSTGTAVRAYASTDTEMKSALSSDTTLSAGDFVVVEAPVNPDDTSEYICRYNYYTVDGEPLEPETPVGTQIEGTDIYWYYDEATTTLSFTGTGALPDWSTLSGRPWHSNIADATKIVIGEGITVIGKNSFRGSYALEEVVFPEASLTTIGESAFQYTNITEFVIPDSVTTIGANAFYWKDGVSGAKQLTAITIPSSVTSIDSTAFTGQTNVVIKCYSGSAARTYARNNDFTYFLLDKDYELGYAATTNTATYRSFTEQATTAIAIIYNRTSGVINDIHFEEISLDGFGTAVEVVAPEDFSEEAGSVTRIMLWHSWDDITPLCDDIYKAH